MSFMQFQMTPKGSLWAGDCAKCGAVHYAHEWASWDFNNERDAMQAGTMRCQECGGLIDKETVLPGGKQYAARYSAPGYLDCTDWQFDANKRRLARAVRELYGPGAD